MKQKIFYLIPLALGMLFGLVFIIFNSFVLTKKYSFSNQFGHNLENYYSFDDKLSKIDAEQASPIINIDQNNSWDTSIKILFFGDLMLDRYVADLITRNGLDSLLAKLTTADIFADNDLISVNLEGAITSEGKHYPPDNLYDFAFKPDVVKELIDNYHFNYFALANNHISDQGKQGLQETREYLREFGVSFSGNVDAKIDSFSRQDLSIKNINLALISLSMVYAHFSEEEAKQLINQAKKEVDFVIVNIHWGNEYEHNFNIYQQNVAHKLIDFGADLIIGHHPHVVQGMEIYNNKAIFYSLGNFIFDQYFSLDTQEGLIVMLEIKLDRLDFALLPFQAKMSVPQLLQNEERDRFLEKFINWSQLNSAEKDLFISQELSFSLYNN